MPEIMPLIIFGKSVLRADFILVTMRFNQCRSLELSKHYVVRIKYGNTKLLLPTAKFSFMSISSGCAVYNTFISLSKRDHRMIYFTFLSISYMLYSTKLRW